MARIALQNPARISNYQVAGFFFFWSVIAPAASLFVQSRLLTFAYIFFLIGSIALTGKILTFRRAWILLVYFLFIAVLMVVHTDISSILNLLSLFFSIYAIAWIAYRFAETHRVEDIAPLLLKVILICLVLGFIVSTIVTAVGIGGTPDYFWNAFAVGNIRIELIKKGGVSYVTWLFAWAYILYVGSAKGRGIGVSLSRGFWLIIVAILLVFTKNRIALIFIGLMFVGFLYSIVHLRERERRVLVLMPAAVGVVAVVVVFIGLSFSQSFKTAVANEVSAIQSELPAIRISSNEVTSGRDILNAALFRVAQAHPFVGGGNTQEILKYGVNEQGGIAESADQSVSQTESPLPIAVKYGWPFFGVTLLLVLSPFLIVNRKTRVPASGYLISLTVVATFFLEGEMTNFYLPSALYLFMVFLYYFIGKRKCHES